MFIENILKKNFGARFLDLDIFLNTFRLYLSYGSQHDHINSSA